MREVAALSTSLPVEYGSGIFVRVDEERPDVLKVSESGGREGGSEGRNLRKTDNPTFS